MWSSAQHEHLGSREPRETHSKAWRLLQVSRDAEQRPSVTLNQQIANPPLAVHPQKFAGRLLNEGLAARVGWPHTDIPASSQQAQLRYPC